MRPLAVGQSLANRPLSGRFLLARERKIRVLAEHKQSLACQLERVQLEKRNPQNNTIPSEPQAVRQPVQWASQDANRPTNWLCLRAFNPTVWFVICAHCAGEAELGVHLVGPRLRADENQQTVSISERLVVVVGKFWARDSRIWRRPKFRAPVCVQLSAEIPMQSQWATSANFAEQLLSAADCSAKFTLCLCVPVGRAQCVWCARSAQLHRVSLSQTVSRTLGSRLTQILWRKTRANCQLHLSFAQQLRSFLLLGKCFSRSANTRSPTRGQRRPTTWRNTTWREVRNAKSERHLQQSWTRALAWCIWPPDSHKLSTQLHPHCSEQRKPQKEGGKGERLFQRRRRGKGRRRRRRRRRRFFCVCVSFSLLLSFS